MTTDVHYSSSNIIYHYTSPAGLLGILGTRSIWLSDTHFLNDLSEVRYAASRVYEYLKTKDNGLANRLKKAYLGSELQLPLEDRPYVASFCKNDNLLSMWRSYGAGGFSIGFDRHHLDTLLSEPCHKWDSLTSSENEALQNNNYGLKGETADVTYDLGQNTIASISKLACMESLQRMSSILSTIKNPQFYEEQEVRIIAFGNSCVTRSLIREGEGRLILYRPLVFPFEAVRSITVGPGVHQISNLSALKQYFNTLPSPRDKWAHVEILSSDTPFRYN